MAETSPLSGAQFMRTAGADPEDWAREFLAAYAAAEGVRTDADRLAYVTGWFKDAMATAERCSPKPLPTGADTEKPTGADPDKWARACLAHGRASVSGTTPPPREAPPPEHVEFLTRWFADAMDAAVKAAPRLLPEGQ